MVSSYPSVSVPNKFWTNLVIFMKLDMNIMTLEDAEPSYFLFPSNQYYQHCGSAFEVGMALSPLNVGP
jgi:hypothetical protein